MAQRIVMSAKCHKRTFCAAAKNVIVRSPRRPAAAHGGAKKRDEVQRRKLGELTAGLKARMTPIAAQHWLFNLIDNAVLQQSRNLFLMALVP